MEPTPEFFILVVFIALVAYALLLIRRIFGRRARQPVADKLPLNGIVVDGSNVMHWGGDPSAKVLCRVIAHLEENGLTPFVIFDANVGYKLGDRYMDDGPMATLMGLPTKQVIVVDKGQIADEIILQFAKESGFRIVTNDRFRDWAAQYDFVKNKGRMVRGNFREGALKVTM